MLLLLNLSNALANLFRFLPASGSNGSFILCLILPQLDYKPKHFGINCLITLMIIEHRVIWCQNLVDNLSDVYRNRRREMPQRPIVNDGIITCKYGVPTCNLHVNHMLKETKLNKTKQNKNSSSSSMPSQL